MKISATANFMSLPNYLVVFSNAWKTMAKKRKMTCLHYQLDDISDL